MSCIAAAAGWPVQGASWRCRSVPKWKATPRLGHGEIATRLHWRWEQEAPGTTQERLPTVTTMLPCPAGRTWCWMETCTASEPD